MTMIMVNGDQRWADADAAGTLFENLGVWKPVCQGSYLGEKPVWKPVCQN